MKNDSWNAGRVAEYMYCMYLNDYLHIYLRMDITRIEVELITVYAVCTSMQYVLYTARVIMRQAPFLQKKNTERVAPELAFYCYFGQTREIVPTHFYHLIFQDKHLNSKMVEAEA